jgi:glutathione S-transferase
MKFYDCQPAPSPRRVRIFIAEKGLLDQIEIVPVDLRGGQHLTPAFDRLNPFRTVPVLELDDGTCISECIACCKYLEAAFPEPPLMGRTPKEQGVIAMWEHRCEWDGFIGGAEMLRNSAPGMKDRGLTGPVDMEQIPALAQRGRKRIAWFHDFLDKRLSESEFVGGESYSIADITALISIDFAARQKATIPETHTNLKRWHEQVSARPSAKA